MRTFILSFLISFHFLSNPVKSFHLVGGAMYYECVGVDSYVVTLIIYRDCSDSFAALFDDPGRVGVFDTAGNVLYVSSASYELGVLSDSISYCPDYPFTSCLERATYKFPVNNLMEAGGICVAYQRCCRNAALSNIADPIAAGATYFVHIPEPSVADCNSSPRFTTELNAKLCYGYSYLFDGSAFDPDGDSLTYRTFTPFHGGSQINPIPITPDPPPYTQVTYAAPFTSEYPINSIPPYELDEHTGMIAVTPSSFGTFLICLAVIEHRNGFEIGTVFRDFEWIVSDITGTDLLANFNDVKVEPNPFSAFVSLTSPFQSTSKLMVTDSRGKVMLKKTLRPLEKISIDETELGTEGILFFRLISEEGKVVTVKAVHLH